MLTWIDWLLVLFGFGMENAESTPAVGVHGDENSSEATGFPVVNG